VEGSALRGATQQVGVGGAVRLVDADIYLDETWTRDLYLHLLTNSTLGKEFKVQTRNFLTWI
jgi:hypothetical protein